MRFGEFGWNDKGARLDRIDGRDEDGAKKVCCICSSTALKLVIVLTIDLQYSLEREHSR